MSFNFKYYGKIDISNIGNLITNTELDWDEYEFRQKTYKAHSNTKTIPLIFDETFENTTSIWKSYEIFKDTLNEIENNLINLMGEGKIEVALLINLPKNKRILPHVDSDEHFLKTKRIHIPIVTNDKCNFRVDSEIVQMKQGEIWEIDNAYKVHGVINNGDTDRIHLLIDYKISNKTIKTLL
jgi:aspartyl/asparaginyl beta-hydroxylase (cupin superfamily)